MNLTPKNFDSILQQKSNQINNWYDYADNFELARISADITCINCIKNKGYLFISMNKYEKNDCKSNYLDYNNLSWKELINKIFQEEVKIGGKKIGGKKTKNNNKNKNKKLGLNRKKTNRRLKYKKV
jgi:hypothetical protein